MQLPKVVVGRTEAEHVDLVRVRSEDERGEVLGLDAVEAYEEGGRELPLRTARQRHCLSREGQWKHKAKAVPYLRATRWGSRSDRPGKASDLAGKEVLWEAHRSSQPPLPSRRVVRR